MKIIGIIAEYNPLHLGHIAQLEYARNELKADYIIVAMSGNFTQRGIPAVLDKFERARLALISGADMVIEIPVIGATSSAYDFSRAGVATLNATGIVTDLLFGSEEPDIDKFYRVCDVLDNETFLFKKSLREHIKSGDTYAKARSKALDTVCQNEGLGEFISSPNNILGIEYIRALKAIGSDMNPHPMGRVDNYSSSNIRMLMESGHIDDIEPFVSEFTYNVLKDTYLSNLNIFKNDFSLLLADRLLMSNDFSIILDSDPDLSRRTIKYRPTYISFSQFADTLKSKNITHSHIMRYLLHILLLITRADLSLFKEFSYAPYIRVLDFKKDATELFGLISDATKVPMFRSPQEASSLLDPKAWTLFSKDLTASDMYRITRTSKSGISLTNEYTRHFEPL